VGKGLVVVVSPLNRSFYHYLGGGGDYMFMSQKLQIKNYVLSNKW